MGSISSLFLRHGPAAFLPPSPRSTKVALVNASGGLICPYVLSPYRGLLAYLFRTHSKSNLKKANLDWQGHRIMEGHFALHHEFGIGVRTIQRTVRATRTALRSAGLADLVPWSLCN